MNCLSWNCRGLGNPRTVRQLQDLASRFKPEIVVLMEVKINMEKMERIKVRLKFEGIWKKIVERELLFYGKIKV